MRYQLLSFLCAATVIAYLQRSALGVPSKAIESELGLTAQDMGLVWLAWYAGYAAFQLPAGWIADRLGSKSALITFAVLWSTLTAVVGAATSFTGLWVLWGLMGIAQAGIFVCATKAIGATFPRTEHALASGALACCMAGGAALSQFVTGRLLGPLAWQEILVVYAVPGLVWAFVFALVVPRPEQPPPESEVPGDWALVPPAPAEPPAPAQWSRLLTDRNMLLLCAQQFQRAGAVALFFTWFPRYLQETKGVSVASSGGLAAWPLLAGMLGGLLGGTISDWLLVRTGNPRLSRQGLAACATTVCAGVSLAAFYADDANTAVLLISVAAFCGYASGVSAYATALSMGGKRVAPVFATMNMAGNIGAGLFPFVVGQLVGGTGNWNLTLLLFAGMFAGSAVCWTLLNPKGTLFEEPE
ncbi:MFS transporter [Gemmata sp. G18]|uniref:MFS transporter n=1 Tax=Gemmata palustris TaxID=2822762 RepID=A0ABS5C3Z3_9BACT|nr:MFS transporter [Gemmata palustris]MBP3960387.1 MFS transporter [Gemmata palustris]